MNKFVCALMITGSIGCVTAHAGTHVDVMINNNYIKTDAELFIENDRVLVPLRNIAEVLECEVEWDSSERVVSINHGDNDIELKIGDNTAIVNGEKKKLDVKTRIKDDRTFVPIRFFAETFDADVSWNSKSYTVYINKEEIRVKDEYIDESYTTNDLEWLSKIIHAEAQGEPQHGKIGVGNVVINRVRSKEFPNSIYDVIFDRKYGIQFTPIANGAIHNIPGKDSILAAKCALNGENSVGNSLYFCNPSISTNFWISNNRPFFTKIGKHEFYL